jgi:hypothetical protein
MLYELKKIPGVCVLQGGEGVETGEDFGYK